MRCSQCELPLSPTRSHCPRCGTPINANISNQAKAKSSPPSVTTFAPSNLPADQISSNSLYEQGNPGVSAEATPMYTSPTTNWNDANTIQTPNSSNTLSTQTPFPAQQPLQVPFPPAQDWQSMPPSEPVQQANTQATFPMTRSSPLGSYSTNNPSSRFGQSYFSPQDRSKRTKMGFTVAGLCIMAGSFLLIFVYLVGQGFFPGGETTPLSDVERSGTARANQTATAIYAPTSTTTPITATPTLPGQDLLDTSVLASNFNEQTGQIIQESTAFKANQKIYVVFSLHQGGNMHAACLNWYLNDQLVNQFAFDVSPFSNYNYYSYVIISNPGSGHINISLASTKACTDAILAQKLSFTVSP
jgi:hypothetical protein